MSEMTCVHCREPQPFIAICCSSNRSRVLCLACVASLAGAPAVTLDAARHAFAVLDALPAPDPFVVDYDQVGRRELTFMGAMACEFCSSLGARCALHA